MRCGLISGLFLLFFGVAWALNPDATREQVIAELGKPTSVAKLGKKEIMIYPGGVRLELEEGKVVAAKGIVLTDGAAEPVKPAAAAAAKKDNDGEAALAEKKSKQLAAADAAAEQEYAKAMAKNQAEMEKTVEGLEASHDAAQHPPPVRFNPISFILEAGLKFLLTVAALKLACKYWGAEVFWSGIFTVAAADAVVRGGMALFGRLVLGFPTLFYADEAAAALVMVVLLKKLSINHAIGQAIQLTLTTKTFSVVVGSFLVSMILRLLH